MSRFLAALLAAVALGAVPVAAFDYEDVVARASKLAAAPFVDDKNVPAWLLEISYDQWRDIRFRPDRALWRGDEAGFEVQFFHTGLYYDRAIRVNVVEAGEVTAVHSKPSDFDYGKNDFGERVPEDIGFAGFRVHYPIKTPAYRDEVAVFLGASYFRAIGRDDVYGLSARGLAIDTVGAAAEEFPFFREFWLVRPAPGAKELTIYALLDSPSVAGAYRFTVRPGVETQIAVDAFVASRRAVRTLGIAPLTSMFFIGENTVRCFEDFRPEVHDSDGLQLHFDGGEWLWRPLENPRSLHVSAFEMTNPRGFGLIQRDRDFEHHQDLETRSELRPSAWIVPRGDWGAGRVELVELPTDTDIHDNIVSYWVPAAPPKPGEGARYSYTTFWYGADAARPPEGRVVATRRDRGTGEGTYRFVVDFAGAKLSALGPDQAPRGVVTVASGAAAEVVDQHVVKNPVNGQWRLTFQVRPKGGAQAVELRAFLGRGDDALSETWSYTLIP